MIKPQNLKPGDTIAIVSPAGKIKKKPVDRTSEILKDWGLKICVGSNILGACGQYSGSDVERASDFQEMLNDENIRAIFCARGGYGSNRIIDRLNFSAFINSPKWIIGFSDITVFHSHIHANFQIETIHGTMTSGFDENIKPGSSIESLRNVLFGGQTEYKFKSHLLNRKGKSKGIVTGGNLAILCSLVGTASDIQTNGKILFIEDVGEYLYRFDRMMLQLRRAGKLSQIAGLIVGGLTQMKDNEIPFGKTAHEIVIECVKEYSYPVCFDFPAGHQDDNRALVFGRKARLEIGDYVNLDFYS